jgi:hypothetical protein
MTGTLVGLSQEPVKNSATKSAGSRKRTARRASAGRCFAQKVILWEASPTPISLSFKVWQQSQAAIAVRDRSHKLFVQTLPAAAVDNVLFDLAPQPGSSE